MQGTGDSVIFARNTEIHLCGNIKSSEVNAKNVVRVQFVLHVAKDYEIGSAKTTLNIVKKSSSSYMMKISGK